MSTSVEPKLEDRGARPYAAISAVTTMATLPTLVSPLWTEIRAWLGTKGLAPAGPPFVRYLVIDMPARIELEVAIPTATAVAGDDRVRAGVLPAGRYATLLHTGPVEDLVDANAALQRWAGARGIVWQTRQVENGTAWIARTETYLRGPEAERDSRKHRTEIAYLTDASSG